MVLSHEPQPEREDVEYLRFQSNRGRLKFDPRYLDGSREARLLHDDIRIVDSDPRRWLQVVELGSPLTVRVNGAAAANPLLRRNEVVPHVYFSINGLERGIEVIRLYQINVEPHMYFLDGELFPWKPAPAALVRRPIVLLKVEWLREVFERNNGSLGEHDRDYDTKLLPPIPASARRCFFADIALRENRQIALDTLLRDGRLRDGERRMRERELYQIERWLGEYKSRFAECVEDEEVVDSVLRQLCPVTWKTLELALCHRHL